MKYIFNHVNNNPALRLIRRQLCVLPGQDQSRPSRGHDDFIVERMVINSRPLSRARSSLSQVNQFDLCISLNSANKMREQSSLSYGQTHPNLHKIVNHMCKYMPGVSRFTPSLLDLVVVRSSFHLTRISSRCPADISRSSYKVLCKFCIEVFIQ